MDNKLLLIEMAGKYLEAGFHVIPDHPELKHPAQKGWQTYKYTIEELTEKINQGWNIGIAGIEGIDIDNIGNPTADEIIKEWVKLIDKSCPGLVSRLVVERSTHGGYHIPFRCDVIEGSLKLAKRLPTEDELKENPTCVSLTLIETRGDGGQFVVSPSAGYKLVKGDWLHLPTVTPQEREAMLNCARSFDKLPTKSYVPSEPSEGEVGERPGDLYNEREIDEAYQLLKDQGWEEEYRSGQAIYLRRPGKKFGISATFGFVAPGVFYCFTANGAPFEPSKAYSPFAVYTILKHEGDFKKAASALSARYGMNIRVNTKNIEKLDGDVAENTESAYYTDTTNAEKIVSMFGDEIRYDNNLSRWLVWNNHRWEPDADGLVRRRGILASRQQLVDAAKIEDEKRRKKAIAHAMKSEGKVQLSAALDIAKALHPITDDGRDWDLNNMLLGCSNGVVDLSTGSFRDGRPEDRITMRSGTTYDKDATCPRWDRFLSEVFEGDETLIHYVQKALGYSITGDTREQVVFFCTGAGSNGKSVLFRTIAGVLGDYYCNAPLTLFQRNINATNSDDLMMTVHKRFLVSSEVLVAAKINEQRLKTMTGGDQITARLLYKNNITFQPTAKPWIFVNHKPRVDDDSHGFWRRVRMIPFNRKFVEGVDADLNLPDNLKKEYPGILNWLIEGCLMWQAEGLSPTPLTVKAATQDYQAENDALAGFIDEECVIHESLSIKAYEFYTDYKTWAGRQGFSERELMSRTMFGIKMGERFKKSPQRSAIFYVGVGLKSKIGDGFDFSAPQAVMGSTPFTVTYLLDTPSYSKVTENDPQPITLEEPTHHNPSHTSGDGFDGTYERDDNYVSEETIDEIFGLNK